MADHVPGRSAGVGLATLLDASRWRFNRRPLLQGIAAMAGFVVLLVVGLVFSVQPMDLMGEVLNFYGDPAFKSWYYGAVAELGILVWIGAAALLLVGAYLPGATDRAALRALGLLTILLALDDRFAMHDRILQGALGLPEEAFLAAYGVISIATLLHHRRTLVAHPHAPVLLAALVAFGFSAVFDVLNLPINGWQATEESLKLLGVCWWCAFAAAAVRANATPVAPSA